MKSVYEKPWMEIEFYELDTAIASGCSHIVSLGPEERDGLSICEEYKQDLMLFSVSRPPEQSNFYEDNCSCYLSAGGDTIFTS